jgi:hypothetical protein
MDGNERMRKIVLVVSMKHSIISIIIIIIIIIIVIIKDQFRSTFWCTVRNNKNFFGSPQKKYRTQQNGMHKNVLYSKRKCTEKMQLFVVGGGVGAGDTAI